MSAARQILQRLHEARRPAVGTGPCSVRIRLDPQRCSVAWLAALQEPASGDGFYWRHPESGTTMLALGRVRSIESHGADRFREASLAAGALWRELEVAGDPGPASWGPLLVGGFAFAAAKSGLAEPAPEWSGFPAGRLVLPELLVLERGGELWLTATSETGAEVAGSLARGVERLFGGPAEDRRVPVPVPVHAAAPEPLRQRPEPSRRGELAPGPEYRVRSDRSHAAYRTQVEAARRAIADGDLEKVVLARSLRVQSDTPFDVACLLERLARIYPRCVTFAVTVDAARFVGATPELLVARSGRAVRSAAVAGSAPRGRTPEEDERLGAALRESKKEQEEHAIVVRAISRALGELCPDLAFPESPRLLRLEGIQHLETPIVGTLDARAEAPSVLDLGACLHPTPAVSGAPAPAALDWIDRFEGMERGWYAGPIGFVDRDGGGELRVALRSGLVRSHAEGSVALLYAGGGLVADSDPERELEETRVKLRALLAPLTEI